MQIAALAEETLDEILGGNRWRLNHDSLERLAIAALGHRPKGWMRRKYESMVFPVRPLRPTGLAEKLPEELEILCGQVAQIKAHTNAHAALYAASFFTLRFEYMHPLHDGNGRIGRYLLAAQMQQAYNISVSEFLSLLNDFSRDYGMIFNPGSREMRFEMMSDLVAQIVGIILDESRPKQPFSLDPVYPDMNGLVAYNRQMKTGRK